jgi:GrpB-like predicted nucleotidyltransferase (UPF0157 family)
MPIELESYDPNWSIYFDEISLILNNHFTSNNINNIVSIEHIGSTSTIGLTAKPIIDIDIIIESNYDLLNTFNSLKL